MPAAAARRRIRRPAGLCSSATASRRASACSQRSGVPEPGAAEVRRRGLLTSRDASMPACPATRRPAACGASTTCSSRRDEDPRRRARRQRRAARPDARADARQPRGDHRRGGAPGASASCSPGWKRRPISARTIRRRFTQVFHAARARATRIRSSFVPFLLEGVAGQSRAQSGRRHPSEREGAQRHRRHCCIRSCARWSTQIGGGGVTVDDRARSTSPAP